MSVVLIGGSSSVGKTTVAAELGARFGFEHVRVDDLRRRIDHPDLRLLKGEPEVWDLSAEELCSYLVRAGEALKPHLHTWIEGVPQGRRIVLEGEGIHPELILGASTRGLGVGAIVLETDSVRLYETLLARDTRGAFCRLSEPRRRAVAAMNQHYAFWLRNCAEELGVPWLDAQPWATLAERVMAATVNRRRAEERSHA